MKKSLIPLLNKTAQKIVAHIRLFTLSIRLALKGEEGRTAAARLLAPFFPHFVQIELAWFNDIIINNYFNWLVQKYAEKKVATISSIDFLFPTFFTKLSTRRQQEKAHLQEANVILVPISQNAHWYLLIIEKGENDIFNIIALDGFNHTDFHPSLWQKGEDIIAFLHPEALDSQRIISKQSLRIVRQNNAYDCGAVICYFAKEYCEKMQTSQVKSAKVYTLFREEIAQAIASHQKEIFFNFGRPLALKKHHESAPSSLTQAIKSNLGL